MDFTQSFCRFLSKCRFEHLSARDVAVAGGAFLDGTGVCLAGGEGDEAEKILEGLKGHDSGPCRVIGTRMRVQPVQAAFANGVLAHSIDYDDVNHPMMGHPTAVLLPVVYALADAGAVSGREAITAYAAGLELAAGLGRIVNPWHYEQGWHATSSLGTLAAAATAARILGLKPVEACHALSLAASQAGGLRRNFGSMAKPFHAGHAARCGLEAALLASRGFTASPEVLEGPMGLFSLYGNRPARARIRKVVKGLGKPFELTASGLAVKQYPCCAGSHPALDAVLQMRDWEGRQGSAPDVVRVHVHPLLPRIMIHDRPGTPLEARFSIRYCIAAALLDGRVSRSSFTLPAMRRKGIARWMGRIEIRPDLGREGQKGEIPTRAKVLFLWNDGRKKGCVVNRPLGSPDRPLPDEIAREKFRDCAGEVLPERRISRLISLFSGLEEVGDLRRITRGLVPPGKR